MNIFIHANCQGAPLSKILNRRTSKTTVIDFFKPVHELTLDDKSEFASRVAKADVILTQNISNAFGEWCSTENIRSIAQHSQVIVIPTLFFNGYFPSSTYVRGYDSLNSFSDYHDKELMTMFYAGYRVEDALAYKMTSFGDVSLGVDESINELKFRELMCDVVISDYIEENYLLRRLFWTMNHPDNYLLDELAVRVLIILDLPLGGKLTFAREFLGETVIPIDSSLRINNDLKFDNRIVVKGVVHDAGSYINKYYEIYRKFSVDFERAIDSYKVNLL
jgi:hypothetical protein